MLAFFSAWRSSGCRLAGLWQAVWGMPAILPGLSAARSRARGLVAGGASLPSLDASNALLYWLILLEQAWLVVAALRGPATTAIFFNFGGESHTHAPDAAAPESNRSRAWVLRALSRTAHWLSEVSRIYARRFCAEMHASGTAGQ